MFVAVNMMQESLTSKKNKQVRITSNYMYMYNKMFSFRCEKVIINNSG